MKITKPTLIPKPQKQAVTVPEMIKVKVKKRVRADQARKANEKPRKIKPSSSESSDNQDVYGPVGGIAFPR